jgi:hypothetical protein
MMAVENRRFLRRAVRCLAADAGITQFLDIGTGLPTRGYVKAREEISAAQPTSAPRTILLPGQQVS